METDKMPTILDCTYHPALCLLHNKLTINVGASNNISLLSPSFHESWVQHIFPGSSAQVSELKSRCQPAALSSRGSIRERSASKLRQVVGRLSRGGCGSEGPAVWLLWVDDHPQPQEAILSPCHMSPLSSAVGNLLMSNPFTIPISLPSRSVTNQRNLSTFKGLMWLDNERLSRQSSYFIKIFYRDAQRQTEKAQYISICMIEERRNILLSVSIMVMRSWGIVFFSNSVFSTFYNNKHIIFGKNLDASCPYLLKKIKFKNGFYWK